MLWHLIQDQRSTIAFRNEIILPFVHSAPQNIKEFTIKIQGHKLHVTNELLADVFHIYDGASTAKLKDIKEPTKATWKTIFPRRKKEYCDLETKTWHFSNAKEH